jgi:GSH-dependent disulfide-bond oxidoreductase
LIRFYFHPTPNLLKGALFLEEAGLAYEVIPADTRKGEQHTREFRAVNPNGKLPAIVDTLTSACAAPHIARSDASHAFERAAKRCLGLIP